jgi:5-methylcytosine-specific restriction protein B
MKSPQVRDELRKVLEAQRQFSAQKTSAMDERRAALFEACDQIRTMLTGKNWADGLEVGAKDGAGSKSRVPWIRVFDRKRSPSPTSGYYVVFLFRGDGDGVYLSVNQGTQDWNAGHLGSQPQDAIQLRAADARNRWKNSGIPWIGAAAEIDLRVPKGSMPKNYELGNVAAVLYQHEDLPDDDSLCEALEKAVAIYRSVDTDLDEPQNTPKPVEALPPPATPLVITPPDLATIVKQAADALEAAGLRFGNDTAHLDRVRAFLVSLATRRFVILTGLSGSGKTQLALRVGQWLGHGCVKLVAVRPDWTGPEALLGYEDALQPRVMGRPAWHVPAVLAFLLRACAEPNRPFVLVLDEMNLAHVERYFADLLSGMESGVGCLPNLARDADGCWRERENSTGPLRVPSNLFVVGTVNVDETTYQFSPKVLDRANTIEFRVATSEFGAVTTLADVKEAPATTRDALLSVARDDGWHSAHAPPYAAAFADSVRALHRILSRDRFEFGHRAYHEAHRFAALLHAAGSVDMSAALDLLVLQKVLPRLHGGRRRLDPCLRALAWYCAQPAPPDEETVKARLASPAPFEGPTTDAAPALPRSLEKIERMRVTLQDHQFASFAE